MMNWVRFAMRLTHTPSGLSAETDSNSARTERQAFKTLLRIIKAKLILYRAEKKPSTENNIFLYEFPDEVLYSNELEKYRISSRKGGILNP